MVQPIARRQAETYTARMARPTTLQHVADAAGVHRSTASRALDPATSRLISPGVVARVTDVALRLGYRRDLLAAGLRNSRSRLVGVLVPDMANPVFAPILGGVEAALALAGYATLVAHARPGDAASMDLIDELVDRRAEGVILATARTQDPLLARCLDLRLPAVLVNRADLDGRLPAATSDDRAGMELAVRHLASLGHRRIAHLAGPGDVSTGRLRAEGFRSAMAALGLASDRVAAASAYTRDAGRAAAAVALTQHPDLTAIAAANDLLALGAYQALAERGLHCPRDVSVTGYNDMPLVDMVQPPLTTVRIPHDQIGREGARLLLERMALRGTGAEPMPTQTMLAPALVVRASTARPRAAASAAAHVGEQDQPGQHVG
jgi:LacI family transcriptional regulator